MALLVRIQVDLDFDISQANCFYAVIAKTIFTRGSIHFIILWAFRSIPMFTFIHVETSVFFLPLCFSFFSPKDMI